MGDGLDIATLGLRIDATQVPAATQALRGLETQGARVEAGAARTTVGMGRLNNALLGVARSATGTSPVLARMVDIMLGLAISGVKMTLILGGLTALALGYRKLTEDSRNARAANEELIASLRELAGVEKDLATQRALAAGGSALRNAQRDLAQIRGRDWDDGYNYRNSPTGRSAWNAAVGRQNERVNTALNRVLLMTGLLDSARSASFEPYGPTLAQLGDPLADMLARANRGLADFNEFQLPGLTDRMTGARNAARIMAQGGRGGPDLSGISTRLGSGSYGTFKTWGEVWGRQGREDAFLGQFDEQRKAEEALAQARERANASLIVGLANVGRAYGGVADQVLNLAAATLSLERMPMDSRGDKVRGYGSAALAGIGYGASTGSAELGLIGGAASGAAMAGPYGAIVGGLSGIVAGVFEAGRRAREAQRMWRMALEDFATMFDEITPQMQVDRTFKNLAGGFSASEIEANIQRLTERKGVFQAAGTWGLVEAQIDKWNDLLKVYADKSKDAADQTDKLAKAENDLYDARFRALNAPSGFNVSYYGWGAGGASTSGGGTTTKDDKVDVHVYIDSQEVSKTVVKNQRRAARRGGSTTVVTTAR